MSILQEESAPAADQKAIEDVQAVAERLTPAGKRMLLARIAKTCLTGDVYDLPLADEEGDVFAYLSSTKKPVLDWSKDMTKEERANFERNLFDPKNHMTDEEIRVLLSEAYDRKSQEL